MLEHQFSKAHNYTATTRSMFIQLNCQLLRWLYKNKMLQVRFYSGEQMTTAFLCMVKKKVNKKGIIPEP